MNSIIEDPTIVTDLGTALGADGTGDTPEDNVVNAIEDLQETLANDEVPEPEQVEELFENFLEMDEESQEAFLDTFEDLIDPSVLEDYETLFGSIGEDDLPEMP